MNGTHERERGFTLIEMMIVVAIIAILVAVLVPNFIRARAQAQTAACESNLKSIATAIELYQTDHNQYPTASAVSITATDANLSTYLKQVPVDPANPTGHYIYTVTPASSTASSSSYTITCPGFHDPATTLSIGGTGSKNGITYSSDNGFTATAPSGQ